MWTDKSSIISPQNIAICLRKKTQKCSSASPKNSTRLNDYALESVSLGVRKVLAHTLQRHYKLNLCAAAVQGFVLSPWHNTLPQAACWMPAQPLNCFYYASLCITGLLCSLQAGHLQCHFFFSTKVPSCVLCRTSNTGPWFHNCWKVTCSLHGMLKRAGKHLCTSFSHCKLKQRINIRYKWGEGEFHHSNSVLLWDFAFVWVFWGGQQTFWWGRQQTFWQMENILRILYYLEIN